MTTKESASVHVIETTAVVIITLFVAVLLISSLQFGPVWFISSAAVTVLLYAGYYVYLMHRRDAKVKRTHDDGINIFEVEE